jgi:hypothetical protein
MGIENGVYGLPMIFQDNGDVTICINPNTNFSFLIDTGDVEIVAGALWYNNRGYVWNPVKGKLHRAIVKPPENQIVDHKNKIRTDNRRDNLRVCNIIQNNLNKSINKRNTSGYRGVYWDKEHKKWRAGISYCNKSINLGYFKIIQEAAKAYNRAASKLFGEYAHLNIIKEEI